MGFGVVCESLSGRLALHKRHCSTSGTLNVNNPINYRLDDEYSVVPWFYDKRNTRYDSFPPPVSEWKETFGAKPEIQVSFLPFRRD